ncbi:myoneurin-like [Centropristis striata]|uniref:myoneurin-like n=1 Tax=Centropristis striata TaxID=184440 RepID=UPI0027E02775|nr:myoneurin-like [Centropristis striata]
MADFSSRIVMSPEVPAAGGGSAGKAPSSSAAPGNGGWEGAASMDQITVVRIDDTHILEEQCLDPGKVKETPEFYEVEYSLPAAEEVVGEDEDDGVYVIEYSNPEEEGESYQFTMSVDRPLPTKKQIFKHPVQRGSAKAPLPLISRPPRPTRTRKRRKLAQEEEEDEEEDDEEEKEEVVSNKSMLELGEDYSGVMATSSGKGPLVCTLCPPPGKFFKRGAGLAVHLKHMHFMQGKKTFFCTSCQQSVRTQIELDQHTRRHANHDAVFTCSVCPEDAGYKGSKTGLKKHLEAEHPGLIPRCHVCHRAFKSLMSYLADQFRHVGVSPYHCAKCQIYEMTERGLTIHIKNHDKKKTTQQPEEQLQAPGSPAAGADNSATDDSDV